MYVTWSSSWLYKLKCMPISQSSVLIFQALDNQTFQKGSPSDDMTYSDKTRKINLRVGLNCNQKHFFSQANQPSPAKWHWIHWHQCQNLQQRHYNIYSQKNKNNYLNDINPNPQNWLIVDTFNSYSPRCGRGCWDLNRKGEEVEDFIISKCLVLLNKQNDPHTHTTLGHGERPAIFILP